MRQRKWERNETEAVNLLERVFGSGGVEKVDAYANHDPFGFADIVAIKPSYKVLFVQVKTNTFRAKHRRKYIRRLRRLPDDHAEFEVWTRVDYEGWQMSQYEPDTDEFNRYLTMETCKTEPTVEALREHFDGN